MRSWEWSQEARASEAAQKLSCRKEAEAGHAHFLKAHWVCFMMGGGRRGGGEGWCHILSIMVGWRQTPLSDGGGRDGEGGRSRGRSGVKCGLYRIAAQHTSKDNESVWVKAGGSSSVIYEVEQLETRKRRGKSRGCLPLWAQRKVFRPVLRHFKEVFAVRWSEGVEACAALPYRGTGQKFQASESKSTVL